MQYLRTPDSQFENLADYGFTPNYISVDDQEGGQLRMHYLDEGDKNGQIILLMHGNPSWSYLYRHMIKALVEAGYRIIAPDLIGFGRSDKPTQRADYTYGRHVFWAQAVIDQLELNNITLFCQDWGGLIGLRLVAENPNRFVRVMAANTALPTGDIAATNAFLGWRDYSQKYESMLIGSIIASAVVTKMTEQQIAAYDAPFPDERFRMGAREFPMLVPTNTNHAETKNNRAAWEVLKQWEKPFLTAFGDSDDVFRGNDELFQKAIPGCQGQKHITVKNGAHFLQEDQSDILATTLLAFIADNPL
mgnify:FL=1